MSFWVTKNRKIHNQMRHLGLPLHACHGDPEEDDYSDDSYNSDVVNLIEHDEISSL